MKISDNLTYFYIKNIKRWMPCPACNQKMFFLKKSDDWICSNCKYTLSEVEYLDDYVFWFCDCCNTYLNMQRSFDKSKTRHICLECGFENDTTSSNIVGICKDCGIHLKNPNGTICEECKIVRLEKAAKKCDDISAACDQLKQLID